MTMAHHSELDEVVSETNQERYTSRGVTAFKRGASVMIVKGGYVRAMISWIGGDKFVETWEYEDGDWRAEVIPRDEVGLRGSMTVESLAFA